MAQVISYGGTVEGNSNTSCSVGIVVGRNALILDAEKVSVTNNFKFCRLS